MRVIILRHGPAGERDAQRWPDDDKRPLSDRGEERTLAAARGLIRIEPGLRLVVTSPLVRAEQTARILAEAASGVPCKVLEALRPAGSHRAIVEFLAALRPADNVVALVGHEPDLGRLAGVLVFGTPMAIALKKAGACAIDFEARVKLGAGSMRWMLTPRLLRRLAGKRDKDKV